MTSVRVPPQAQILTTERCNLACRHCAVPAEDSPVAHEVDAATWRSAIDELVHRGVHHIWFTGGEPLLRRDLPDLVRSALSAGAERVVVVTNGTVFTPDRARRFSELSRSSPRFALHVSIDGCTRATHDAVRGTGAWDRTMDGIARLRAEGGRVDVIQFTLTRATAHEIDELPGLLDTVGARGLHLFSLAAVGRAVEMGTEHASPSDWDRALRILGDLRASGRKVSAQGPIDGEDWELGAASLPRAASHTTPTMVIGPDGAVFPCPFLRHVDLGNALCREHLDATLTRLEATTEVACGTCRYLPMCAGLDLDHPFTERVGATTHPHEHFPLGPVPVSLR